MNYRGLLSQQEPDLAVLIPTHIFNIYLCLFVIDLESKNFYGDIDFCNVVHADVLEVSQGRTIPLTMADMEPSYQKNNQEALFNKPGQYPIKFMATNLVSTETVELM